MVAAGKNTMLGVEVFHRYLLSPTIHKRRRLGSPGLKHLQALYLISCSLLYAKNLVIITMSNDV